MKMHQSNGSRTTVIAKAKIISAFIATEEEVNVPQNLLICNIVGKKKVPLNPAIRMPILETFTGRAYLSF